MNDSLKNLVEALREELKQYGEMLVLLDHQQEQVMHRQTTNLLQSVADINRHADVIRVCRHEREQHQRHVARLVNMEETAGFIEVIPLLPSDYRPLISALVQENNELMVRIKQRARQNHLLLNRVVELMQRLVVSISPAAAPSTYTEAGTVLGGGMPKHSLLEAIG
jgi:flagellar biosynthesis/type III secretory pathway chaperone